MRGRRVPFGIILLIFFPSLFLHSQTGTITGTVFQDNNKNALFDAGEPGLHGWQVEITGWVDTTVTTDSNGVYRCDGLPYGVYLVRNLPQANWYLTEASYYYSPLQDVDGWYSRMEEHECRLWKNLFTFWTTAGQFHSANGTFEGWVPSPITADDFGTYTISAVSTNQLYVIASSNYYRSSAIGGTYASNGVTGIPTYNGLFFRRMPHITSIDSVLRVAANDNFGVTSDYFHGRVLCQTRDTSFGLGGWRIDVSGSVDTFVTTDSHGYYSVPALPWGFYTLSEETQPGWIQKSPSKRPHFSNPNDTVSDIRVLTDLTKIWESAMLWQDLAVMYKYTPTNDSGGSGSYTNFTIPPQGIPGVVDPEDVYSLYSNTGTSMQLLATSRVVQGEFWINLDQDGYIETPTYSGPDFMDQGTIDPSNSHTVAFLNIAPYSRTFYYEDTLSLDFLNIPSSCISGIVYEDLNGNGNYDVGEPLLGNQRIFLGGPVVDTTVTDAFGKYSFSGLPVGTYSVAEELQLNQIQMSPSPDTAAFDRDSLISNYGWILHRFNDYAAEAVRHRMRASFFSGGNGLFNWDAGGLQFTLGGPSAEDSHASYSIASEQESTITFHAASKLIPGAALDAHVNYLGAIDSLRASGRFAALGNWIVLHDSMNPKLTSFDFGQLYEEPLAIRLASFTAAIQGNRGIRLSWETVSETNNYGFYVERRRQDSIAFRSVSKLIPGAGTSLSRRSYSWVDSTVTSGSYVYRLREVDLNGTISHSQAINVSVVLGVNDEVAPRKFQLLQSYPNPFNPSTIIKFSVERTEHATLKVYDVLGQEVAELFNGMAEAGRYYSATFDASKFSSGIYVYRIVTASHSDAKKMLLIK